METIGKALTFYLRYYHEMEALYVDENSDLLNGISSSERILKMVEEVGELASTQAAYFLLNVAESIRKLVNNMCNTEVVRRRPSIEGNWRIDIWFGPKGKPFTKKNRTRQFCIGFDHFAGKPILYISIWVKGGLSEENRIADILGDLVQIRSKKLKWAYGNLILGITEIDVNVKDLDKQQLLDGVIAHTEKIPESIYSQIY